MRQDKEIARKKNKEAQRAAFNKKFGVDKAREASKRKETARLAAMSPEEQATEEAEKEKDVDKLMNLLGF